MDFALSDEQRMIADTAQAFFAEQATSARTRAAMADAGIDRALWTAFCQELGFAGVFVPEERGGVGLGMIEFACVAEAAGSQVAALPLLGGAMTIAALVESDTAYGDERLAALISGEAIAAAAADETITISGDGRLSGDAILVAHGAIADSLLLLCRGEAWLVPADAPGVRVTRRTTMDQTRPLAEVGFDNAQAVPLGAQAARAAMATGLLCLAAEALGGAQAARDRTVDFALERKQFGRPIGSFQAYKHRLADRTVEIEQARSAVYWAACAIDSGSAEAEIALPAAKSFCADAFFRTAADMIQLHGGIGFTWEHDAHLFFKRARSIQTLLGTGDFHREAIATRILDRAA
ncbi:acyl-CoA dehydrogenase family protein [Sphingosinithalassobacter portus]|uniref:acyl-CoA dehydrogenase family protein n=1 Tax=Stakelama portus TaxID=2676234 RepID=UPI000D6DCCE1|nr:acyl-CoA dehydrogenase family protein [Sphingosinithalassobacter portus]